jgi:hypothetical protein
MCKRLRTFLSYFLSYLLIVLPVMGQTQAPQFESVGLPPISTPNQEQAPQFESTGLPPISTPSLQNQARELISNVEVKVAELKKSGSVSDNLIALSNGDLSVIPNLSAEDRALLEKAGISVDDLNSLVELKNEMNISLNELENETQKLAAKGEEFKNVIEKDFAPGLLASIIGTLFAAFYGIEFAFTCSGKPSVYAFNVSSLIWVASEIKLWGGYKIQEESIKNLGNTAGIKQDAEALALQIKISYERIRMLKAHNNDVKDPNNNISGGLSVVKTEVGKLRELVKSFLDNYRGFRDDQLSTFEKLLGNLENIAQTTVDKGKGAKIAGMGYTVAAGMATIAATTDYLGSGACFGDTLPPSQEKNRIALLNSFNSLNSLLPTAHANSDTENESPLSGVKKGSGLVDMLNQMGIIGAIAIHGLLYAYRAWKGTFMEATYTTATARAIFFAAMAGVAFYASSKLDTAGKFIRKQIQEVRRVKNLFATKLGRVDKMFDSADSLLGYVGNRLIPRLDDFLKTRSKDIREYSAAAKKAKDAYENLTPEEIERIKQEIKEKNNDGNTENQDQVTNAVNSVIENIDNEVNEQDDINETEVIDSLEEETSQFDHPDETENYVLSQDSTDWTNLFLPVAFSGIKKRGVCFQKGRRTIRQDPKCSCVKNGNCTSSFFPKIKVKKSQKVKIELLKAARLMKQHERALFQGETAKVKAIENQRRKNFKKIHRIQKGLLRQLVNKKPALKKKLAKGDRTGQSLVMGMMMKNLRQSNKYSSLLSKNQSGIIQGLNPQNKNQSLFSHPTLARLRRFISRIKEDGGKSILASASAGPGARFQSQEGNQDRHQEEEEFEILIYEKDRTKDLFEMISRRYYQKFFLK